MAPTTCACASWKTAQQDGSDDPEEGVDGEKDNDEVEIEMFGELRMTSVSGGTKDRGTG